MDGECKWCLAHRSIDDPDNPYEPGSFAHACDDLGLSMRALVSVFRDKLSGVLPPDPDHEKEHHD